MNKIENYTFNTTLKFAPYTALLNNHDIPLHRHLFWEITYTVNSSITNYVNDLPINCDALSKIIIMKPNDTHKIINNATSANTSRPCHHRDIYVHDDKMQYICDSIDKSLYHKLCDSPIVIDTTRDNLESLEYSLNLFQVTEPYLLGHIQIFDQLHHIVICQILGMYLKNQLDDKMLAPDWIEDFLSNLKNEDFLKQSINEILSKYPYSHGYLCREFKKFTGKTMVQYLNESRIIYSTILLLNNTDSILDIAMTLNYSSQSAYINAFKKIYNMPPSVWRKQMAKSSHKSFNNSHIVN